MAYLDVPRLHFAGQFYADPSTIDNTPANFQPHAPIGKNPNFPLDWNPMGTHTYEFRDCVVKTAVDDKGKVIRTHAADPVIGARFETVLDFYRYPAKLVDLDPEQQMVSQIWGLQLRVGIPDPKQPDQLLAWVSGVMPATAFTDLWGRVLGVGSMSAVSAAYQSVLSNLVWHNEGASPFLVKLKQVSGQSLSIRFIVDSYEPDDTKANFRLGRVVGTVGPAFVGEPSGFILGRRLSGSDYGGAYAKVDAARKVLTIDLGNTAPTMAGTPPTMPPKGWAIRPSTFVLGLQATPFVTLGTIAFTPQTYSDFAGVVEVPIPAAQLQAVQTTALVLVDHTTAPAVPAVAEDAQGLYVDVSQPVFRLNPGEKGAVVITAQRFGVRAPGVVLPMALIPQGTPDPNNTPASAMPLPPSLTTGPDGTATLLLAPTNPGAPRPPDLDGQIYFIGGPWTAFGNIYAAQGAPISVLVFTEYAVPARPTWDQHIRPIFEYYATIYPFMKTILDLADYDTLMQSGNGDAIQFAINLPIDNPHHMPVLRDLSAGKRKAINLWIDNGMPRN